MSDFSKLMIAAAIGVVVGWFLMSNYRDGGFVRGFSDGGPWQNAIDYDRGHYAR